MSISTTAPHDLIEGDLTSEILGAAIDVHRVLGPGLLESAYEACTCRELTLRDIPFRSQVALPVHYKGVHLDCGYRIDLVVCERAIVELKSVERLAPIHESQLLTYLRLSKIRVGLSISMCQCYPEASSEGFYEIPCFTTEARNAQNFGRSISMFDRCPEAS